MLPIALGALSAAGSLLGDVFNQSQARKAQKQAIEAYKKLLIPGQETNRRADMYGDDVYTRTMGELNEGAFAYAGALNPETMRTIAFSKMGVARSQVETGVREQDYQFNKGVQAQMAQVAAQPLPGIDLLNAAESGVGGYLAGKNLGLAEDYAAQNKDYMELLKTDLENKQNYGFSIDPNSTFAPSYFNKKTKKGLGLNMNIPADPMLPKGWKYF